MKVKMRIGLFLLIYRNKHKLTQKQLGIIIESSQSQISRWECGSYNPSKLRLDKIKKILKYV